MNRTCVAFGLVVLVSGWACSQDAATNSRWDVAAVLQAEAGRNAARESGNKEAFARFMLDDFWEIDRFGHQFGKSEAIQVPVYGHNELDDYRVRVYGDTAVVTGRARFHDAVDNLVTTRFTNVWIRTSQGWREASHHACVESPAVNSQPGPATKGFR